MAVEAAERGKDKTWEYALGNIEKNKPDYIRWKLANRNGYIVLIKVSEGTKDSEGNNSLILEHLKNYFICSDNRTYKGYVTKPLFLHTGRIKNEIESDCSRNLLVYGAPGTGKSHFIDKEFEKIYQLDNDEEIKNVIQENYKNSDWIQRYFKEKKLEFSVENDASREEVKKLIKEEFLTRVTFYEDYTYESFVGCYKPKKTEDGKITYEYEPGPFIKTYLKAVNELKSSQEPKSANPYFLVIEEINRAKAAAVFGDMFQLLDRDYDSVNYGQSEYTIKPETALDEFLREKLRDYYEGVMRIPSNMYIWATMNSADQGVYVLDSAFKRRWQFQYMDINPGQNAERKPLYLPIGKGEPAEFSWDAFRTAINEILLDNDIEEDRCIGAYFFKDDELDRIKKYFDCTDGEERIKKINPLVDKLFAYLIQDVVKRKPDILFKEGYQNMTNLRGYFSGRKCPITDCNIEDVLVEKIKLQKLQPLREEQGSGVSNNGSDTSGDSDQS